MDVEFVEKSGRKRIGETAICGQCGKEFVRRKGTKRPQKYCGRGCMGAADRKEVELKCHTCGKGFIRKESHLRNSRSGLRFCSRECKEVAQSFIGGCFQIQPPHYGSCGSEIRKTSAIIKDGFQWGCEGCGDKRLYILSIHHIDGDRNNNARENLEIVCRNCHAIRHLRFDESLEEWVFSTHALTPRELINGF